MHDHTLPCRESDKSNLLPNNKYTVVKCIPAKKESLCLWTAHSVQSLCEAGYNLGVISQQCKCNEHISVRVLFISVQGCTLFQEAA